MGLEWETMFYWYRRAVEIFEAIKVRPIKDVPERVDAKVDTETFQAQKERLYKKIAAIEKQREGTIK